MEIKSFDKLIVNSLLKDGKKYVSNECKNLLSNGENYGSIMLDVKVTLTDKDGNEEVVNCVAKTCPPKGICWMIFNVPYTVKKEIAFYQTVIPTLNNFGKTHGIDEIIPFFAKTYGSRISLDPNSDVVDTDAALLLENMKLKGYGLPDRFIGFNLEEAKIVLKNLTTFHAVPIALKLQKPDEFKEKIKPTLARDMKFNPPSDMIDNLMAVIKNICIDAKLEHLLPKLEKNFKRYCEELVDNPKIKEPFATMVHNDLWVNNVMFKYDNNIPSKCILVDFQGLDYSSPTNDLLFLLYTSIDLSLIETKFDDLVKYYFESFIDILKKLKCPNIEQFTFEAFLEEMALFANEIQLYHIILMCQPIYMKKEDAKDLSKMEETMNSTTISSLHENFKKKIIFVLSNYEKRGWI